MVVVAVSTVDSRSTKFRNPCDNLLFSLLVKVDGRIRERWFVGYKNQYTNTYILLHLLLQKTQIHDKTTE